MTRKELMQRIVEQSQEYLGFPLSGVDGLTNKSKAQLEQRVAEYDDMLRLKRESDEILNTLPSDVRCAYALMGDTPDHIKRGYELQREASNLWLKGF